MEGNCRIRELRKEEIGEALDLVSRVFQAYEAPDYTEEGVETFYQSAHEEGYLAQLRWYGAFVPEGLVGVGNCILGYAAGDIPAPAPRKDTLVKFVD